ncbi:MAG: hypothetical protein WD827_04715 [Solirubrobacterales bacterium]
MAPWKLPLVVAAIAVPIVAAFLVGGPGLGTAVGALAAVALLVVAARQSPRGPIGSEPTAGNRRTVLMAITCAIEEPAEVQAIAREAHLDQAGDDAEIVVLAPASIGFLDRWASDVEGARREAQTKLVATVAALAKAGIAAEGRVGDEDVVQAVEDQLQGFPASEVVLVSEGKTSDRVKAAAEELRSRLRADFHHVALPPRESSLGGHSPQS